MTGGLEVSRFGVFAAYPAHGNFDADRCRRTIRSIYGIRIPLFRCPGIPPARIAECEIIGMVVQRG